MSQSLTDADRLSAALFTLLQAGKTEVSSSVSISQCQVSILGSTDVRDKSEEMKRDLETWRRWRKYSVVALERSQSTSLVKGRRNGTNS